MQLNINDPGSESVKALNVQQTNVISTRHKEDETKMDTTRKYISESTRNRGKKRFRFPDIQTRKEERNVPSSSESSCSSNFSNLRANLNVDEICRKSWQTKVSDRTIIIPSKKAKQFKNKFLIPFNNIMSDRYKFPMDGKIAHQVLKKHLTNQEREEVITYETVYYYNPQAVWKKGE